jgi:hypothetical protein
MMYPIVAVTEHTIDMDTGDCEKRVGWYRSAWHRERGIADIEAREEGVFISVSDYIPVDQSGETIEFLQAVKDAFNAVRSIRYGTTLESFQRDLSNFGGEWP